jgi:hypothetical protein
MYMNELQTIFPTQIIRGALLRPDGVAVGLVMGGAPAWDLRSLTARGEAGADYHRLLLALDAPIDVYVVDQPPDLAGEIAALHERQLRSDHPLLADVLSEIADYLTELGHLSGSRAKQVVWAVAVAPGESARGVGGLDIGSLLRRDRQVMPARRAATLTQAVDRARRLANGLDQLGGTPAPRLLEAEEIAQLLYGLADPMRAQRYPLAGPLLHRLRRVVTPV